MCKVTIKCKKINFKQITTKCISISKWIKPVIIAFCWCIVYCIPAFISDSVVTFTQQMADACYSYNHVVILSNNCILQSKNKWIKLTEKKMTTNVVLPNTLKISLSFLSLSFYMCTYKLHFAYFPYLGKLV